MEQAYPFETRPLTAELTDHASEPQFVYTHE